MVDFDEHDGERLEPEVEQCVDERDVEVEYKDNGLLEIKRERPDQHIDGDIASSQALSIDLRLRLEPFVTHCLA